MRFPVAPLVAAALVAACTRPAAKDQNPPLTQRQRDSVVGASKLPGAAGVRGALRAEDSAAARRAREDSIANSQ